MKARAMQRCMATLLLATLPAWAGAHPAAIWRCGSSYSSTPCEGGRVVDAGDDRTNQQRTEARQAMQQDARSLADMRRERLRNEASMKAAAAAPNARRNRSLPADALEYGSVDLPGDPAMSWPDAQPPMFTATIPGSGRAARGKAASAGQPANRRARADANRHLRQRTRLPPGQPRLPSR